MIIGMLPINSEKHLTKVSIKEVYNCFAYNKKIMKDVHIKKVIDLLKYSLILPSTKTTVRNKLDDYMESKKVRLNPCIEVSSADVALEMIRKGMGIGYFIIDSINIQPNKEDYEIIVFDDLPIADISLVYIDDYTSIAAKKFINLIKNK